MSSLQWLATTAVFTALLWIPYVLERLTALGVWASLSNPTEADLTAQSDWAKRARRAHANAIENLVVMATLVLVANATHKADGLVATATLTYFVARVVHFAGHTAKLPAVRTLAFAVCFVAQLAVAWAILS